MLRCEEKCWIVASYFSVREENWIGHVEASMLRCEELCKILAADFQYKRRRLVTSKSSHLSASLESIPVFQQANEHVPHQAHFVQYCCLPTYKEHGDGMSCFLRF